MSPRRRGVVALRDSLVINPNFEPGPGVSSLRQQLADLLRQAILTGVYEPGQRLIERELVERFGVSSIPVREALQDLESQGLVVKRPNVGCSVLNLTREDIIQIVRFLRVLQPHVVMWAAEAFTPADAVILRARVGEMRTAAEASDVRGCFQAALLLQKTIWTIAGNPWASRTLESALGSLLAASMRLALERGFLDLRADAKKFDQLVQFLAEGNGEAAAAKMDEIATAFEAPLLQALASEVD